MKPLDFYQLQSYIQVIGQTLDHARFQDIWTDGQSIVLELYKNKNHWLLLTPHSDKPLLLYFQERPKVTKKPKPLILFLKSHAENLLLKSATVISEKGRVVLLEFSNSEKKCSIEIRLIPQHFNVIAHAEEKSISWLKPKDLPDNISTVEVEEFEKFNLARVLQLSQDWLQDQTNQKPAMNKKTDPLHLLQLEINKKMKTIEKIQLEISAFDEHKYLQLGEILKYQNQLPAEFQDLYDDRKSISENREEAFRKAKDIVRKRKGAEQRIEVLQKQIVDMQKKLQSGEGLLKKEKSVATEILTEAESRARKKVTADGFEFVIGKTGKDNLAILRQARAWDYWFHLKDYPGAHAILFREKNQKIPDASLHEVAKGIVEQSLSRKMQLQGLKYQVIMTECRYVKAVKGAQGLVTYQNERQFTFRAK